MDETLLRWASPRQVEFLKALDEHQTYRAAALSLGLHKDVVRKSLIRLRKRATLHGWEEDTRRVKAIVAEPYIVRGKSTYYDKDHQPTQEWVKTRLDDAACLEAMREAAAAFAEGVGPLDAPSAPAVDNHDIIPWIQIGDAHLGMLAHEAETGANFDLKIAEREMCAAISILIDELPNTYERLVINDLGDFTHYENSIQKTEASGHDLDADGRFPKMIKVYSRVMRFIIEKALEKAAHVDCIFNQGNHSRTNDIWMAELVRVAFGHTGRVNVLNNDSVFVGYRMGKTFVLTHHSDKCRPAQLAHVMATDFHRDWGESEYRYIDIGHIHHGMVLKEHPGVTVESWNNLTPRDKYAHEGGWRSRQSITLVRRSRTYGEVGRRKLPVEEVRDRIRASMPSFIQPYQPQARMAFRA